ncbi:hypothetical protein CA54_40730 [Symmachiella macrocystis]|uniref:1-phosphatidylinositol phosphodiesterase n=1 Tax=Symmachiella macrocystis TaxID=2527985 RepID=A0A5C6BC24_9PLAN|nr:PKD domain-containing protein [Symmachiella macrocystis]TWU08836.1 hypothetical protein CA54_40730 [Symmachiella macrocystis]
MRRLVKSLFRQAQHTSRFAGSQSRPQPPRSLYFKALNGMQVLEDRVVLSGSDFGENGDIDDHELSAVPLWMAGYTATNNIEANDTWLALKSQSNLSIDEPISNVLYLASHNSFNTLGGIYPEDTGDGVQTVQGTSPNQSISITNQLNVGVRSIEMDLWAGGTNGKDLFLRHGAQDLVGIEIEFDDTLQGIKDWLDDPANANEIVFLDFEDRVEEKDFEDDDANTPGARTALYQAMEIFDDMIYSPADRLASENPHGWPTRRELIAAGKRVVIFTHRNDSNTTGVFGAEEGAGQNGESGFSTTGHDIWAPYKTGGYQGDYQSGLTYPGQSPNASWTFDLEPGEYEVAATWEGNVYQATDAPYTVLDGSTSLATIDVNQSVNPNDFTDEKGVIWENLGVFTITGNTLTVQLTTKADEYVIADAIRINKVVADPSESTPQIIDNDVSVNWKSAGIAFLADGGKNPNRNNYEQVNRNDIRDAWPPFEPEDALIFSSMQSDGIRGATGVYAAKTHDLIYAASRNLNFAKVDFVLGYQNDVDQDFETPDEDDPMQNDGPYGEDDPNTPDLDEGHKHRGDRLRGLVWSWAAGDPAVQRQLFQDLFHDDPSTLDVDESNQTGQGMKNLFLRYFAEAITDGEDKTLKDLEIAYEQRFHKSFPNIPGFGVLELMNDLSRRGSAARNNGRDFVVQEQGGSNWISTGSDGNRAFALRSVNLDPYLEKYRWKISTEMGGFFDSDDVDLSAYTDDDGMEYMFAGPINGFQNGSFDRDMLHPDVSDFRDNEILNDVLGPYSTLASRPAFSVFEARIKAKFDFFVGYGFPVEAALVFATESVPEVWLNVQDADRDGHWQVNVTPEALPVFESLTLTPEINEGDMVSLAGVLSDAATAETYTMTIDWGDGSAIQTETITQSEPEFSFDHTYVDDGESGNPLASYNVNVSVMEGNNNAGEVEFITFVSNVDPTISNLFSTETDENGFTTLSGTIVDPGVLDTFTLDINWGDSLSPENVQSVALGDVAIDAGGVKWNPLTREFAIQHQYLDDNPTATLSDIYTINLTITDDDTGTLSDETTVIVNNVDPAINLFISSSPKDDKAYEGDLITVSGLFSDAGVLDTHTAVIDWGDGASNDADITETGGSGSIAGEHIYVDGGVFEVIVTLTDDDGGVTTAQTTIYVTGAGVLNGVLQVVGTNDTDHITINRQGNGKYKVHADFFDGFNFKRFPASEIESIEIWLCQGDDHLNVAGNITDLPIAVHDGGRVINLPGNRGQSAPVLPAPAITNSANRLFDEGDLQQIAEDAAKRTKQPKKNVPAQENASQPFANHEEFFEELGGGMTGKKKGKHASTDVLNPFADDQWEPILDGLMSIA